MFDSNLRVVIFFLELYLVSLFFPVMASKEEKRSLVLLEAQRILRESLKTPLLSNNLAEGVDNSSAGIVPVFLMPEDKSGSVLLEKSGGRFRPCARVFFFFGRKLLIFECIRSQWV